MVVRWSREAQRAVKAQYNWYVKQMGRKVATKFLDGILSDVDRIEKNPGIGRIEDSDLYHVLAIKWRSFVSGRRYKIVYMEQDQCIEIVVFWACA